jgi:hypothetical protein
LCWRRLSNRRQDLDLAINIGGERSSGYCLNWRSRGFTPALDQRFDRVSLLGFEAAELVFHVHASVAAHVEKVLALDIQLPRQDIDANFLLRQKCSSRPALWSKTPQSGKKAILSL